MDEQQLRDAEAAVELLRSDSLTEMERAAVDYFKSAISKMLCGHPRPSRDKLDTFVGGMLDGLQRDGLLRSYEITGGSDQCVTAKIRVSPLQRFVEITVDVD